MVIFSVIFLTLLSFLKFSTLRNPAFYFIIIHYLHNFSFSVLKQNGIDIFWRADPSVDFSTIDVVVMFNLISLWLVCIPLILFINKSENFIDINIHHRANKICLYIYILFSLIILYNNSELILGNIIYGSDQALNSFDAFDPLARLWNFRVYFIAFYLVFNNPNSKIIFFIVVFELLMSFLLLERKDLAIILLCLLVLFFNQERIRFNLTILFSSVLLFLSAIILPIYRSFDYSDGFINKLSLSFDKAKNFHQYSSPTIRSALIVPSYIFGSSKLSNNEILLAAFGTDIL